MGKTREERVRELLEGPYRKGFHDANARGELAVLVADLLERAFDAGEANGLEFALHEMKAPFSRGDDYHAVKNRLAAIRARGALPKANKEGEP